MFDRKFFLGSTALLSLLLAPPARAQWLENGSPVVATSGIQGPGSMVTNGAGGAFFFWPAYPGPDEDVYVQQLTGSGARAPGWPAEGILVAYTADGTAPPAVADGAGGFVIAWSAGPDGDVFVKRIASDGTLSPGWPADGLLVCSASGPQQHLVAVSDGAGGLFAAWEDWRNGSQSEVFVHHVRGDGTVDPAWPVNGTSAGVTGKKSLPYKLLPDGAGGVIVLWMDGFDSDQELYAQRLTAAGSVATGWPAQGLQLAVDAQSIETPAAISDGADGFFLAWQDTRSLATSARDIYALHVLGNGHVAPSWPASGVPVCTAGEHQIWPSIVRDGDEILVGWADLRVSPPRIHTLRLLANGNRHPDWSPNGDVLCPQEPYALGGDWLVPDGSGGAYLTWTTRTNPPSGETIHALRITASADPAPGWPCDGVVVRSLPSGCSLVPTIISDGANGALIGWTDSRDYPATEWDFYASRITSDGIVGVPPSSGSSGRIALAGLLPNPSFGAPAVRFRLTGSERALLEVFDLAGRRLASRAVGSMGAGWHTVAFDGAWAAGACLIRLRQGAEVVTARGVILR